MRTKLFLIPILSIITRFGYAGVLGDYFEHAVRNDHDYLIAIEKIRANEVDLDITKSRLLPSISAQLNNYRVDQTRHDAAIRQDQNYNSQSSSLQITVPVYSPRLYRDLGYQKEIYITRELEREVAKEDLVIRLYEKVLVETSETYSYDRSQSRTSAYFTYYKSGLSLSTGGRLSEQERDERHKLFLNSQYELTGASQRLVNAKRELAKIIGRAPNELQTYSLDDRLVSNIREYLSDESNISIDPTLSQNARVRLKRKELAAAKLQLRAISGLHYPDVNIFGQVAESKGESSYFTATHTSAAYLGLQVTIPLYSGGGVTDRERQQLYKIREAEVALERELKNLNELIFQSVSNLRSLLASYDFADESLKLIQKKIQRLKKAISDGNKSSDELTPAMIEYFDLTYTLKAKRVDIFRQYLNLEIARGTPVNQVVHSLDTLIGN